MYRVIIVDDEPVIRKGLRDVISFENQFKELCKKLNIDRNVKTKILPSGEKRTKGLCVHALRHTAITMANTAQNGNVINTALMAGHTAINTENVYTHSNIEALKQIETPGKAVLGIREGDNENTIDNVIETGTDEKDKENELYQMYLKLKDHFNE